MEMVLILAAGAAFVLACVAVALSSARTRRPPLRTRREEELAGDDEEALIASLRPLPASPIDRGPAILDLEPIEPRGAIEDMRRGDDPRPDLRQADDDAGPDDRTKREAR